MVTDARTSNRNYPKPHTANKVSEDFPRLIQALDAIDTDIAGLLTSVAARALAGHTHTIANVTGLQSALDGKAAASHTHALADLTDVDLAGASNGQYLRRIAGKWQPATIGGLDASAVTSGVFDPARIPVLIGQSPVVSSGDLSALTSGQQAQIIVGTVVITTDGNRWVYAVNGGDKTSSASYIQLADVTPDWAVIANKPSTFSPSAHSHPISDVSGLQAALDGKVALFPAGAALQTIAGALRSKVDAAHGSVSLIPGYSNTVSGWLEVHKGGGSRVAYSSFWDGSNLIAAMTDGPTGMIFGTNGTSRVHIGSDGRVGIGTTAPSTGFEVNSDANVAGISHANEFFTRKRGGDNGGIYRLQKPDTGNSLAGDVAVDSFGNFIRFFEDGGTSRGANLDLAACAAGAGSVIVHSGNIGARIAAMAIDAVGGYGFFCRASAVAFQPGETYAGSVLAWSNTGNAWGATPGGTWVCLGSSGGGLSVEATLYKRVA